VHACTATNVRAHTLVAFLVKEMHANACMHIVDVDMDGGPDISEKATAVYTGSGGYVMHALVALGTRPSGTRTTSQSLARPRPPRWAPTQPRPRPLRWGCCSPSPFCVGICQEIGRHVSRRCALATTRARTCAPTRTCHTSHSCPPHAHSGPLGPPPVPTPTLAPLDLVPVLCTSPEDSGPVAWIFLV